MQATARLSVLSAALTYGADGLKMGTRIINGTVVKHEAEKYPFFALPTISPESDQWLGCGASIISPTFALTSAHCFGGGDNPCSSPGKIGLWMGDLFLQEDETIVSSSKATSFRTQADVICHSSFDGKCSHGHDVALLKLSTPLPAWVKPVPVDLGTPNTVDPGKPVTVVGFGLTETADNPQVIGGAPSSLHEVTVSVLPQDSEDCNRIFAGGYGCSDELSEAKATNRDQQVCAGTNNGSDKDACAGDSGSPMVNANGVQVAIVSYGGGPGEKKQGPGRTCGDPRYPGVYAKVSAFADFLREHVHDLPGTSAMIA